MPPPLTAHVPPTVPVVVNVVVPPPTHVFEALTVGGQQIILFPVVKLIPILVAAFEKLLITITYIPGVAPKLKGTVDAPE